MKVLVTGSKGFIGKNLIWHLRNLNIDSIFEYNREDPEYDLNLYCKDVDIVFHLAGINRTNNEKLFDEVNVGVTETLISYLKKHQSKAAIIFTSSIQIAMDNSYAESKKTVEQKLYQYSNDYNIKVYIYRLPNVFGKWCKPNYNSVIATFCNNIIRDIPIKINDPNNIVNLVYVDDVIREFCESINFIQNTIEEKYIFKNISINYSETLESISSTLKRFNESRKTLEIPIVSNAFEKKLYSTYLSYLPIEEFAYKLNSFKDERGSYTAILKGEQFGQFSVNVAYPGETKGNHYHHTKVEKFLVVSGKAVIKFREILTNIEFDFFVDSENLQIVDIPPGFAHSITNLGDDNLITLMWANEIYDKKNADTFSFKA